MSMDLNHMAALQKAQERAEAMQPNKQQQFMLISWNLMIELLKTNPGLADGFDDLMKKVEQIKKSIDRAN